MVTLCQKTVRRWIKGKCVCTNNQNPVHRNSQTSDTIPGAFVTDSD